MLQKLKFAITGPSLVSVPTGSSSPTVAYLPSTLERTCSFYISAAESCFGLAKWTILFWFPFALRTARNFASVVFYAKIFGCFSLAYLLASVCLGIGRLQNPTYARFIDLYFEAKKRPSKDLINLLTSYGFRHQWPTEFDVQTVDSSLWIPRKSLIPDRSNNTSILLSPLHWFLNRTIGVRMIYPGCTDLFNSWTLEPRMKAWGDLRIKHRGRRLGLLTRSGRFVETYYVDRRGRGENSNEDILVICCEGNAGFAEIGVIGAPLQNGYSVVAWNHPGFGSSEGFPYPDQEQDAMEAVLLFATRHLNFPKRNIRLFGWSIGGYTATWAAAQMPQIGGLILDATFDMLDELARNALPFVGESITVGLVHSYFDLHIAAQIARYPGPILILRRSHDEVITTKGPESNRGNYLLVKLLKYRFPFLFTEESEQRLWQFILLGAAQQEEFLATKNIVDDLMEPILQRELRKQVPPGPPTTKDQAELSFPSNLGNSGVSEAQKIQILIYLASKYFREVFGTHCTPLDPVAFTEPWSESRLLSS
ncbi:hypothetical protein AAHC03_013933 [Spirometra sp. Aus1]